LQVEGVNSKGVDWGWAGCAGCWAGCTGCHGSLLLGCG
jgi:hypothetical protein